MVYQAIIKPEYEVLKIRNSSHDFPVHFHSKICIGKVTAGEKCLTIKNQRKRYVSGDIFIVPPYTAHSCKTNGTIDYVIFSIDNNVIKNKEILDEGARCLEIDTRTIEKIITENYTNKIYMNKILKYLIQFVGENYNDTITIKNIAKRMGYNEYYILHLFKEEVGISLHQYIIQIRIKRAKRNNKSNLLDTALENGFYDQSHFIRHFKKYEGITPNEYYKSRIME